MRPVAETESPSRQRPGAAPPLLRFQDARITESSGLAVSSRKSAVLFTHNDSSDEPRFFAVDRQGQTLRSYRVSGAQARDWEDMASVAGAEGPALWFADTGDNRGRRPEVVLYRVAEPAVPASPDGTGTAEPVVPATAFRVRYSDRPHDVEALLVQPGTEQIHLVTKTPTGVSDVYALPSRLDATAINVARPVAQVTYRPTGTPGGPVGGLGQLATTGGAVSANGRFLALRTYTDAYIWPVPDDDVPAALSAAPTVLPLPRTRQGEAITFDADGRQLLTSSEGPQAPVHAVSVAGAAASGSTGQLPGAATPTASQEATRRSGSPGSTGFRLPEVAGALGLAGILVVAGSIAAVRRLRRRTQQRRR